MPTILLPNLMKLPSAWDRTQLLSYCTDNYGSFSLAEWDANHIPKLLDSPVATFNQVSIVSSHGLHTLVGWLKIHSFRMFSRTMSTVFFFFTFLPWPQLKNANDSVHYSRNQKWLSSALIIFSKLPINLSLTNHKIDLSKLVPFPSRQWTLGTPSMGQRTWHIGKSTLKAPIRKVAKIHIALFISVICPGWEYHSSSLWFSHNQIFFFSCAVK